MKAKSETKKTTKKPSKPKIRRSSLLRWTARVSNWKKQDKIQKPLEYHIAHLHSEVSEVFEVLRLIQRDALPLFKNGTNPYAHVWMDKDGHPEGFGIELADVILVACYIASVTGIDLEEQMILKMAYNEEKRVAR